MPTHWVADASPLIVLGKVGYLSLLTQIPDQLSIPATVAREVAAGPNEDVAHQWILANGASHIVDVATLPQAVVACGLDPGEEAVLALGSVTPNSVVLLDDFAARRCAQRLQLAHTGTLGVLIAAKRIGLVHQLKPILNQLDGAGLRVNRSLLDRALELAGEQ